MFTPHPNSYQTPPPAPKIPFEAHLQTPPSDYDHNFGGGPIYTLSTDKLVLVPFVPSLHARQYYHDVKDHGETLLKFMPYPRRLDESLDALCEVYERTIRSLPVGPPFSLPIGDVCYQGGAEVCFSLS
jgi:hypothetical protein